MMPLLYGVHVDIYTDHKNLQYIFKQKDLNSKVVKVAGDIKRL